MPFHIKQTFLPVWIFPEGEGDGVETRLPFKIFFNLPDYDFNFDVVKNGNDNFVLTVLMCQLGTACTQRYFDKNKIKKVQDLCTFNCQGCAKKIRRFNSNGTIKLKIEVNNIKNKTKTKITLLKLSPAAA